MIVIKVAIKIESPVDCPWINKDFFFYCDINV